MSDILELVTAVIIAAYAGLGTVVRIRQINREQEQQQ